MIEYEKKIAQQTLNILTKKSWNAFSLQEVLKKVKVKKAYIKTWENIPPMLTQMSIFTCDMLSVSRSNCRIRSPAPMGASKRDICYDYPPPRLRVRRY